MLAAELLREVRRRHGLTQRQLAARARTSQAAISRIERGLVSPTVETLATLLDLMGEQLVVAGETIDYGHDRTLVLDSLQHDPQARIERQASWLRGMRELQRAVRSEPFDPVPLLATLARAGVDSS